MDEETFIAIMETRLNILCEMYKSPKRGTKRQNILNRCDELNYLISYVRSKTKK